MQLFPESFVSVRRSADRAFESSALVEQRYATLRRQVPIVYLLAVANLFGLQLATEGQIALGLNFPTLIGVCAVVRVAQWSRSERSVSQVAMARRMSQTVWLAIVLCLCVCVYCIYLLKTGSLSHHMSVILFGSLTAIGVSYGLSYHPWAARIPLLVLALPLSMSAFLSDDGQFVGAAISLAVVAMLIWRLLSVHNDNLSELVRSRESLNLERECSERAREKANIAASTDFLTGLPNRRAFIEELGREMERVSAGSGKRVAVAILDLNRFKAINDAFGHATGDGLLQTVAQRLSVAAGPANMVARLGGDEFGVIIASVTRAAYARRAASRILDAVNGPVTINNREFSVSASCGLGLPWRGKNNSVSRILADADLALYQAKHLSVGDPVLFERSMEEPHRRRAHIERALGLPGFREKIHLVFQPIIDLKTRRILAFEALARWDDEELGAVSPSEFVPIAEQLHLIGPISDHLMILAFKEAAKWPSSIKLSFNLSAVQLCQAGLAETILSALRVHNLTPDRLQAEVTETALMVDFNRARHNLDQLRRSGVAIVLDDFGSGYASITYLKEMKFDQIKLDGDLVATAQRDADGQRLLSAVISLCQGLGVSTVAEHVETEQQLRLLLNLGCTAAQGYWLGHPVSAPATQAAADTASLIFNSERRPAARLAQS